MKKINLESPDEFLIVSLLCMLILSVFATTTIANASTRIQNGDI